MFHFHATSTRITDGHGTNFFTHSHDAAVTWAAAEAKAGHAASVYQVVEVLTESVVLNEPPEGRGDKVAVITVHAAVK